jgi:hypothetical protein
MRARAPEIEYIVLGCADVEIARYQAGERSEAVLLARDIGARVQKITISNREEIFDAADQDEVFAR